MPDLTPQQIDQLARDYFERTLAADETHRLRTPTRRAAYTLAANAGDPVEADLEVLDDVLGRVLEALAANDFTLVQEDVSTTLKQVGVDAEPTSEDFRRLARAFLQAHAEVLRIAGRRRVGDYTVQPSDPLFASRPAVIVQPEPNKASPRLSEVVAAFVRAKERDGKWKPLTKKNSVNKLNLFVETLNDKPIDTVTRDDIRDWRDALVDLDLAPNTIRQHFKVVASMFLWAKDEGKAAIDNPTRRLAPEGEENTREAFQPADLEKLFASPLFTGHWRPDRRERPGKCLVKDSKYWFPLIALHTGMRVEEIAKLKTADVREIDGVWCFNVYATKTDAGNRVIPIHPRLIELGFLDFRLGQHHERLWPELQQGSEGKFSQRFCQWWVGFRRHIGLDREGLVFHSFRHTFAAALQQAGVQEAMVALLMGHRHQNITFGRYAGGKLITPRDRLEVIKDINFGVDLRHLLISPALQR